MSPTSLARATAEGTRRYAARHRERMAADAYVIAGDLCVSSLGIGTYLGAADDQTDADYRAAVAQALTAGINVIDTASNYRCQRSERAIGQVLRELGEAGVLARSEVHVSSKAGFVPFDGHAPADPARAIREATVGLGLCSPEELSIGCHCMAPAFLRAMLRQSRANLGLQTLDLYYLHNPEAQLQTLDRPTFEARLRRAFAALEQAVADGEIASYGVATWSGLRARPHERDHLSLARLCELAREIGGDAHHLRTVQLPLNLAMPEAARLQNQVLHGRSGTLLQVADELGVHVVVSAALLQGKLARHSAAGQGEAGAALQFARSLPGVVTALCGMARVAHVLENVQVLGRAKTDAALLSFGDGPARSVIVP